MEEGEVTIPGLSCLIDLVDGILTFMEEERGFIFDCRFERMGLLPVAMEPFSGCGLLESVMHVVGISVSRV